MIIKLKKLINSLQEEHKKNNNNDVDIMKIILKIFGILLVCVLVIIGFFWVEGEIYDIYKNNKSKNEIQSFNTARIDSLVYQVKILNTLIDSNELCYEMSSENIKLNLVRLNQVIDTLENMKQSKLIKTDTLSISESKKKLEKIISYIKSLKIKTIYNTDSIPNQQNISYNAGLAAIDITSVSLENNVLIEGQILNKISIDSLNLNKSILNIGIRNKSKTNQEYKLNVQYSFENIEKISNENPISLKKASKKIEFYNYSLDLTKWNKENNLYLIIFIELESSRKIYYYKVESFN